MKVSLNELVQLLSDRAGQPFNIPLQEELKVILNYKRADWMQKILDKHPEQRKFFLKDFTVELEEVSRAECPITTDCKVLRTKETIPVPVRTMYTLFDYVGDPDRLDGYTYVEPDQLVWMVNYGSKYTKDRPKYFYINGYIYIYNEPAQEYINVRGIWTDLRQLNKFKCGDKPCYTDNDQWEIPDDIINTMMQDVIKNELTFLLSPEVDEVSVDNGAAKTK